MHLNRQFSPEVNVGRHLIKKQLGIIGLISSFTLILTVNWLFECRDDVSFEVI